MKISDLCVRFSCGDNILSADIFEKGDYPVYGGNGIRGYTKKSNFEGECAVIGRQGANCGSVLYFKGKGYFTEHAIVAVPNENICTGYFAYKLSLLNLSKYQGQSAQPGLSAKTLSKLDIDFPKLEDQKIIFSFINSIDLIIQNNKKQIETLESIAKTIYDYWFVQFDFPNEDGRPYKSSGGKMVWNEELKRDIPEGWNCVQLSDVFSFIKGKLPEKLSVTKGESLETYITIDVANGGNPLYCSPQKMIRCDSETIMVMDDAASGDVYVGLKGILGSTFSMIDMKRPDISNSFIYLLLNSLKKVYVRANTGSTVPHANSQYIGQLKVSIPKNCSVFSKEIDSIFEKIISSKEQLNELNSLKSFLLPLLFNGQVAIE